MVNAKLHEKALESDYEMQRTAWQTALIMSASGNYGKKGIKPDKLYKPQFDDMGNPVKSDNETFKAIDKEEKESKLNELLRKFNKE
jgi:hypothetical protein